MTGHMKNKQTFVVFLALCLTVAGVEKNLDTVLWMFETGGLLASSTAIGSDGTGLHRVIKQKDLHSGWRLESLPYKLSGTRRHHQSRL